VYIKKRLIYTLVILLSNLQTALAFSQSASSAGSTTTSPPIIKNQEEQSKPGSVAMDLKMLWQEARANNPQLRQLRESYLSAKAIPPQLAAPSNPQLGLIWGQTPANSPLALGVAQAGAYSITQPIPFPGKKTLAAGAAEDVAESLLAQNENVALQIASQLTNAYYQAISGQKQLIALKEAVIRLEMIKNISKSRYANNAAAYTEYLNSQVAQSAAEAERFNMERQVQGALKTINALIGHDPREPLRLRDETDLKSLSAPTLVELEGYAESKHPLLKSSQLQLEAAKKQLKLAKMAYLPDFQVIGTANTGVRGPLMNSGFAPARSYQIELDIIIPLFFFMKERYGVEQAARNQSAYEMNDLALRQQVILAVGNAHIAYEQSKNQVLFLRDRQLPEGTAAYKVALNAYANNGQGYNDLLVAQNQLRALQIQLAVAQSSLAQNYAALMAAAGMDPIAN